MEQIPNPNTRVGRHTDGILWTPPTAQASLGPHPRVPTTNMTSSTHPIGPAMRFSTHNLEWTRAGRDFNPRLQSERLGGDIMPVGDKFVNATQQIEVFDIPWQDQGPMLWTGPQHPPEQYTENIFYGMANVPIAS